LGNCAAKERCADHEERLRSGVGVRARTGAGAEIAEITAARGLIHHDDQANTEAKNSTDRESPAGARAAMAHRQRYHLVIGSR
jgi:hypothetical protein